MTPEQESTLLERIYDAASADELESLFDELTRRFDSDYLHAMIISPTGEVTESWEAGMPGAGSEYEHEWRGVDPRMALAISAPGSLYADTQHIDVCSFEHSDFYNLVLRPFDIRYSLFGSFALDGGYRFAPALMRSPSRGAYDDRAVQAGTRLLPHLRRAIDLRHQIKALQARVASLSAALDRVPTPLLLIDAAGRVAHINAAAEPLLAGPTLSVDRQRLTARSSAVAAQLHEALSRALSFAEGARHTQDTLPPTAVIVVPREPRRPLSLVVHPLRPRHALRETLHPLARVLVVMHDPDACTRLDPRVVEQLYSLTPTESVIAVAIAEGQTLATIATARGCSEHTVRTHLKRVLDKTSTRRQAELVQLLLGSASLTRR